jgi:glycosyltransferase involved in cell wall biosynthesis
MGAPGARPKLSVIMPVYNERATVAEIIRRIQEVEISKEIIALDDASTDGTREILQGLERDGIRVICHETNQGKGAAIRKALNYANGELVIIQDGDLELAPDDYLRLIEPILEGRAEVVYGSRRLAPDSAAPNLLFRLGGVFLTGLTNLLYGSKLTDEATCYKMFPLELLKGLDIKANRFEFCPEVTAKILKRGLTIHEVPIHYSPRTSDEGKKIRWRDGFAAAWTLIKYRFVA